MVDKIEPNNAIAPSRKESGIILILMSSHQDEGGNRLQANPYALSKNSQFGDCQDQRKGTPTASEPVGKDAYTGKPK